MSLDPTKMPRWALIALLTVTLPVVGWALNSTVGQIERNESDIRELSQATAQLAEATANMKDVQKAQGEDMRLIRQDTNELLRMLYLQQQQQAKR